MTEPVEPHMLPTPAPPTAEDGVNDVSRRETDDRLPVMYKANADDPLPLLLHQTGGNYGPTKDEWATPGFAMDAET